MPDPGRLCVGGVDGVGHAVVLARLPDNRVPVVLPTVVHGHPHAEREGGLPILQGSLAVGVVLVGGDPVVGVDPVEGLLGSPLEGPVGVVVDPVAVVQLVRPVGVIVGQARTWGCSTARWATA